MKILILTTKPPYPAHDGGALATSQMIEGLSSNGAEITVLSIITQKHRVSEAKNYTGELYIKNFKQVFVNTKVKPLPLISNLFFSSTPYDIRRFYSDDFISMMSRLPDIDKYDIIQCEGLPFILYADDIRKISSSPLVFRAHNVEHIIRGMMAREEKNPLFKVYLRNLSGRLRNEESRCRKIFDAVVTISEDDKIWFEAQGGRAPVIVAETGIALKSCASGINKKVYSVGFIGALDWQPNIRGLQWFLKYVWPLIQKKVPEASFFIAGRNASSSTQKSLKGRNVIFEGEVENSEDFISSMNVTIAPLFAGSGMRIKIIESMSVNVPVVATPVAARGIPITDHVNIMIADGPDSFALEVTNLLTDNAKSMQIASEAGKLISERFDNNKITSELLAFYKELANDR